MKPFIKIVTLLSLFTILVSCNSNPIEPEPQPGRRDYVWNVDTIKIPFTYLYRIWGKEPNDVWAVGPGGGLDQTIWHYNGMKWTTDGISRNISPLSIWSYNKNNVWLVGYSGKIWNYDGSNWKQNKIFEKPNYKIGLMDVWGDSQYDIYTTGFADSGNVRKGIIFHNNGFNWNEVRIPSIPYNFLRIKRGNSENQKYYLQGSSLNKDALFEFDGQNITKIFETGNGSNDWALIQVIDGKMFFVIGNTINKYNQNEFIPFIQIDNMNFGGQIFGRNEKDILLRMFDGIAHYNGDNVEYLYRFQKALTIVDGILFEKEVFFLANDDLTGSNIILRGILK